MTDIEKVMGKIEKLLALSESPNEAEAAAAAAKVRTLLVEYNLSLSDVQGRTPTNINPVVQGSIDPLYKDSLQGWEIDLASSICGTFFCKLVLGKRNFFIIGESHDVEVATYTFTQLRERIYAMSLVAMRSHADQFKREFGMSAWKVTGANHPVSWLASWQTGAVTGIGYKLQEMKRQDTAQVTALVVRKDTQIAAFVASKYGKLGSRSTSLPAKSRDAYHTGLQAGKAMDIHAGIGAKSAPQLAG